MPAGTTEFPAGFEWDPAKSAANLAKHGVSFEQALSLFHDPGLTRFPSSQLEGEPRMMNVGHIGGKLFTAVTTARGDNIRVISVRRSRTLEKGIYNGDS